MSPIPHSPTPRRRRVVLTSIVALLLPLGAGCVATEAMARPELVGLSIVDRESGHVLPVYRVDGRSFVAGTPGTRYALRLTNRTSGRQLVVLSVDGINVVSGETAGWNQTGYVLDPWQSFDVAGWRKTNSAIAGFEFSALRDSYAARTDRPDNVGVIGMAVFAEKPRPVALARPQPRAQEQSEPPPMPGSAKAQTERHRDSASGRSADAATAMAPAPAERLGTAHGQREWSVVTHTRFERLSTTPQAVVEIAYDSHRNLVAAGVIRPPVAQTDPRPFPRNDDRVRFVPDPPER
jgi:hypothetical protein